MTMNTAKPPESGLIPFKVVLRWLMPKVDRFDERLPRFKRFVADEWVRIKLGTYDADGHEVLYNEDERLAKAEEIIAKLRGGIDKNAYPHVAAAFALWWPLHLKRIRSASGARRNAKPGNKPTAQEATSRLRSRKNS